MAAISTASEVAKSSVAPVQRVLGYLYNYHNNVEDVRSRLEKLRDLKGEVDRSIDVATRNGDDIDPDVITWLQSANGIIEEARKFLDDEKNAEKRCFIKLCPNLNSRYQFSRKAKKTVAEIVKIQDDGKFDQVSYDDTTLEMGPTSGFEAFESRMSILKGIMEALTSPKINMIGVYGKRGVGKTMLVKEVARKAQDDNLFDVVVMAIVSHPLNVRKIQEQIADKLGLKFDEKKSESDRATMLRQEIENKRQMFERSGSGKYSILVILDDVWEKLDLKGVGIPFGEDYMGKGTKIVVTSENEDTLRNRMGAQMNFLIGALVEQEAWNFFKKMAGDSVDAPELKATAIEIAKECVGLPLAVAAVANALKKKSLPIWKDALQQLRSSTTTNIDGMDAKVYSCLRLSYDSLESEKEKSLFLLSSLLPKDYHISIQDFLKYGKSLGLFQEIKTLEELRNRVHKLIHKLKASCLLLDSDITGSVKMHDVIRDVGISLASEYKQISVVRNGVEVEECTKEEKLRICPAISLPYSDIHELPTGLECPKLKLFLFFNNNPSMNLPNTFFKGMKQLEVLNLTNLSFSSLPSLLPSLLRSLANLQTLCLDQCMLQDIPIRDLAIIGEVKKLEILSFESSNIAELPREIGQLSLLRLLDLRNCTKLKLIPSNVLARLSQLEDLYMGNSFVNWGVDGNASLTELERLPRLVTLDIGVSDPKTLPKDLPFEKLKRYRICCGQLPAESFGNLRKVKVGKCDGLKNLFTTSMARSLLRVQEIEITECKIMVEIVTKAREEAEDDKIVFPQLRSLTLERLPELMTFCSKVNTTPSIPLFSKKVAFQNLNFLNIDNCDKLRNLFTPSMARDLVELRALKITNCEMMEEIVEKEKGPKEEAIDKIMFPVLGYILLENLPKLKRFDPGNHDFKCPSLKSMKILDCEEMKTFTSTYEGFQETSGQGKLEMPSTPFFNKKVAFPILEELVLKSVSLKKIWNRLPVGSFWKLKSLKIDHCDHLLDIVPSHMLMRFQNLESLEVISSSDSGSSLEYLFEFEGINDRERHILRATQLRYLYLSKLQSLVHIWKKDSLRFFPFRKLRSLKVHWCDNMRNIFTISISKSLVQLQQLSITWCDKVEEIVEKEGEEEDARDNKIVFPQVTSLTLDYLSQLKSFCQGIRISEWPSLKNLEVTRCDNVEIIFAVELSISLEEERHGKGHVDDGTPTKKPLFLVDKVAFPNLEVLQFRYLYSMEQIWLGQFNQPSFCNLRVLDIQCCESLTHLLPSAIVKCLLQIKSVIVTGCKMMKEIITSEEGEATCHETIFSQLSSLKLGNLPNLTSFYTGNNTFSLPYLKEVLVENCPKLKIFSTGILNTPKLDKVHIASRGGPQWTVLEDKWEWKDDINSTIRHCSHKRIHKI